MRDDRVPDTSVWIRVIRELGAHGLRGPGTEPRPLWLSSVVVAELYAGTRSREDARIVDRIVEAYRRIEHVVTPTHREWVQAGQLLARRTRLHGAVRPRDHLADLLILLSAARLQGTVVTANVQHFDAWLPLASVAGLEVYVHRYEAPP